MFEIIPYQSVGPIRFGMTADEVIRQMGPARREPPRQGFGPSLEFGDFLVTLSASDETVVEVGLVPPADVHIHGIDIFRSPTAFDELVALDGEAFETVGFI